MTRITSWRPAKSARSACRHHPSKTWRLLLDGLPLAEISTSMTINSTAAILLAFYIAVAKRRGIQSKVAQGHDSKRFAQRVLRRGTYIYPPKPSLRIITDIFAYLQPRSSGVEYDLDFRLSHSRGWIDGGARTGLHPSPMD